MFLHDKTTPADHHLIKRPKKVWPKIAIIIAIILIALMAALAPALANGYGIYLRVKVLDAKAGEIMSNVSRHDLAAVTADLEGIKGDLSFIRSKAKQLGPILYWPSIGKTSRTADRMLAASVELIDGYRELLSVFTDLSSTTQAGQLAIDFSTPAGRRAILKSLVDNRSQLERAKNKIKNSRSVLAGINADDLTGVFKDKIVAANSLLSDIVGQSEMALPLLRYLPELAGYGQEKNYLVLFQNNMELRPSGGFIGSYGLVTIKDGEIISLATDDIYNLDKFSKDKLFVPAPWPMTTYNGQKYLFLRDANWSPDWPTDAKQIDWFWQTERANAGLPPVKLDGIIAITPDFIANFLDLTGPITADGIVFNHDNFALQLERAVEFDYAAKGIPLSERKGIIGDLSIEIMDRLLASSPQQLLKLWLVVKGDIEEKQIIAWLADPEMQEYITQENWTGAIRQADGDYLFVVDANLAALKTDAVMKREISYGLSSNANGDLIGRAEITYYHTGKVVPALISKYRTFTRVYVPADTWFTGAYLQDSAGRTDLELLKDATIGNEAGKRYLGAFLTVEPGASKTLVVEYRLPAGVKAAYEAGLYKLLVQKQPGTAGHKLAIDLKFDQPIIAYQADALPSKFLGKNLIFSSDLRTDRDFMVKF